MTSVNTIHHCSTKETVGEDVIIWRCQNDFRHPGGDLGGSGGPQTGENVDRSESQVGQRTKAVEEADREAGSDQVQAEQYEEEEETEKSNKSGIEEQAAAADQVEAQYDEDLELGLALSLSQPLPGGREFGV